ncbi:MAG: hypothetical protein HYZ63_01595 [Candidatus Andersenbacteria bacterium]|nr:hypothetical protein [Candidatus Andersenbacteria bacterium]
MFKNAEALTRIPASIFVKLTIMSAFDEELLTGLARAWPEFFVDSPQSSRVALSALRQSARMPTEFTPDGKGGETKLIEPDCAALGLPTIAIYLPGHPFYGQRPLLPTPELMSQLYTSKVKALETTVSFWGTTWLVTGFDLHPPNAFVQLAQVGFIDMNS